MNKLISEDYKVPERYSEIEKVAGSAIYKQLNSTKLLLQLKTKGVCLFSLFLTLIINMFSPKLQIAPF